MPHSSPKVTAIIVNYNAGDDLLNCVQSVLKSSSEDVQVIVSDNGSSDGSMENLDRALGKNSNVMLLRNNANLGFGRGNNVALPHATGSFLLFLNPDCVLPSGAIADFLELMRASPRTGMIGPMIRNLDGSEQRGCRRNAPTIWTAFVQAFKLNVFFKNAQSFNLTGTPLPDAPVDMEAISGACMFVRREALDEVGPLDDGYFMHCEDLDWCLRFRRAGWHVMFHPKINVKHAQGVSSKSRPIRVEWYKHYGMIRYFIKFFTFTPSVILIIPVVLSILARFLFIAIQSKLRSNTKRVQTTEH